MLNNRRSVGSLIARLVLVAVVVVGSTLVALPVPFGSGQPTVVDAAGGANGMTIDKTADGNPLIGGPTVYTVTVTNTSFPIGGLNPDGKAYNLDLTDVLPPGVTFVSSPAGTPTITTVGTQQTLVFSNITDVARSQTYTTTITATLGGSPGVLVPNTVLTNTISGAVSNDPRAAASISAGSVSVNTTALPFKLKKTTVQSTGVGQDTGGCASQGTGSGRGFSYDLTATNTPSARPPSRSSSIRCRTEWTTAARPPAPFPVRPSHAMLMAPPLSRTTWPR